MPPSPEERRRIYEEEKARIESEERQKLFADETTIDLPPNVAGLLCYLGTWITGIIFLILEQKNRFIRFHALQSIIIFVTLAIAGALLAALPFIGGVVGTGIAILAFILWIVLMVKAYHGELYQVPVAGEIAAKILPVTPETEKPEKEREKTAKTDEPLAPSAPVVETRVKAPRRSMDDYFTDTRGARIAASSGAIAWNIVLLAFFSFFHEYLAYYHPQTIAGEVTWTRLPLLNSDYYAWLPVLVTVLILSTAGHIALLIYDKYLLRETILIILNVLGIMVLATLLAIFPFDFSVIPNINIASALPIVVRIVLIAIAFGLGISSLVMFIKMIVNIARTI